MALPKSLLCHSVTIFNRVNTSGGEETFRAVVLRNVRIEQRIGVSQQKEGQLSHDTFKLFADGEHTKAFRNEETLNYCEKKLFSRLSAERQATLWTFSEGDFIVPKELPLDWENYMIDDIREYEQVFTVNSVNPIYDRNKLHHWEVSGRGRILE